MQSNVCFLRYLILVMDRMKYLVESVNLSFSTLVRISSSFPDFKRSGNDEFASLIATSWRCFPRTAFQQISCPDPGTFLSPWGSCNPCCDGQTFPSCSIAELLIAKRGEHKTENWTFRLNHLLVLVWGRLLELRTVWFTR